MLVGLTIRDVVLIDRLDLAFRPGLCVLTGETGAGKSILLDSLGLALGARAESGLVRNGAAQAAVTAEFSLGANHPAWRLLDEHGIETAEGESLVLRRTLTPDGRSRAFVNDQPTSVGLLRQLGEGLVEIQGQFEQRGLMDPGTHRALLDGFGGYGAEIEAMGKAWRAWRQAEERRAEQAAAIEKARADEDYLCHAMTELDALDPKPDEEEALAEQRAVLVHREKLLEAMGSALNDLGGAERGMHGASRVLERVRDRAAGRLDAAVAALERAAVEAREAVEQLEAVTREMELEGGNLEAIEERLYALRALARKHGVAVADLPPLRAAMAQRLGALEDSGDALQRLTREAQEARAAYVKLAERIGTARRKTAGAFDAAVMRELAPLKLEKARFRTVIASLPESEWAEGGAERVHFEVATNPGAPPGPLNRIASGGELSRFLLALKVVLAKVSPVPTLVFDEVDSGIGGAVAAAVGERLQRLGEELQVLVVTHSPQVAAKGAWHWRVAKEQGARTTRTRVEELTAEERREEIARMLSGSAVTPEARAAADSLLSAAGGAGRN